MTRKTRNLINAAIGFLLLIFFGPVILLLLSVFVFNARRPVQYLVPDGYVGWIRIEHEIKNAPPLPQQDGYYIAKIPAIGVLRTSSKDERGWAADKYHYLTASGARRELNFYGSPGNGMVHNGHSNMWFIGTKAQLEKFGWSYMGRPGPLSER